MTPMFFGESGRALFGIHHAGARPARSHGIVLCNPFGDEAVKSHRALRVLAARLAAARFHVLRFDYFGTGDSSGDAEEGTVARWLVDVAAALDELKDLAGVTRLSVVGLRFGGTLALLGAERRRDVDHVVAWDPIVDGTSYVSELRKVNEDYLRGELARAGGARVAPGEVMGFPLSPERVAELEAIDLTRSGVSAKRVTLVTTTAHPHYGLLATHLQGAGIAVESTFVPMNLNWTADPSPLDAALVPTLAIDAVVDALMATS